MSSLRRNKLREMLDKGEPTIGTHVASAWPSVVEFIGLTGKMDYVEFVSQYAPYDLFALENITRAADYHGMSTMIKIDADPKTYLSQKAIAAGFQGVLFGNLQTVKEVEEAIKAVRPEPRGTNSCFDDRGLSFGLTVNAKEFVKYYDDIVIALMVEKKGILDRLEDVMNLEDIDMVVVGPGDLSMSLGIAGQYDNPVITEARERIVKMAVKYDKHPRGEISGTLQEVEKGLEMYSKMGVKDFAIGSDYEILFNYARDTGELARKFLGRK